MATAKNLPAKRKPISAYGSTTAQVVVGTGRLGLGTARALAFTRKHARSRADFVTPATCAVLSYLGSGVDPDPLGPLGAGFDAGGYDSPWRLTVGSAAGLAGIMYQRSDGARARRERRRVVDAFTDIGAAEPPSLLHPKGRPVDVKLPTPTRAGSRVVVKVPKGASTKVMENLAPFLHELGQVTVRPVPAPPNLRSKTKTKAIATARRPTPGASGAKSASDQLLAYGHVEIGIRRREVLREGMSWLHLAEMRRPGFKGLSVWDGWHVGYDEDGEPVYQSLVQRDKVSGGVRGSGKSTAMHVDLAALALDPTARIVLMDPSRFAELGRWLPVAAAAAGTPEECVGLLEDLYADGLARLHRMSELAGERRAAGYDPTNVMRGEQTTWLVCDELLALTNHPDKNIRMRCQQLLLSLVTELRKVGFQFVGSTLKPTGDVIPTNLRDNITVRQSFRCPVPEMAAAVLDRHWVQLGYGGHTISPSAPRGVSYLLADDHPVRLVTPYLTEAERDEVLDTALLLRGLPARPPAPAVRESVTLSELSFEAPATVSRSGASLASSVVVLAEPPVALVPDREAPPRPVAIDPDPDLSRPEPPGVDPKLVDEAAKLAVRFGHCSAPMIQRKLRTNWDETAWILAELEDRGVVGPARAGRPDREVLTKKAPEVPAPGATPDPAEAKRAGYSGRKRPRNRRLHSVPAENPEKKET